MIYNDDWLFIHMQRAGGSFVEKFLLENFSGWRSLTPKHCGIFELRAQNINYVRKSFGMVRNPWSWYVSWWHANSGLSKGKTMFPRVFTEETTKDFNKFIKHIFTNDLGVMPYFNYPVMCEYDIGLFSFRFMECHCDYNFKVIVDYIIHRENIKKELCTCLKLNDEKKNILFNMEPYHVGTHKPYYEYYNEESVELVRYKDRAIIDKYSYSFRR